MKFTIVDKHGNIIRHQGRRVGFETKFTAELWLSDLNYQRIGQWLNPIKASVRTISRLPAWRCTEGFVRPTH